MQKAKLCTCAASHNLQEEAETSSDLAAFIVAFPLTSFEAMCLHLKGAGGWLQNLADALHHRDSFCKDNYAKIPFSQRGGLQYE